MSMAAMVRESIAFIHTWISENPRLSIWIFMILGCQSSILHSSVDIDVDIQTKGIHARTFYNGCPWNMNIHVFMDISIHLSMLLLTSFWISIDFYGYPLISMDIHTWTCYEFSIVGEPRFLVNTAPSVFKEIVILIKFSGL